jgi:hypothetical protein
VENKDTTIPVVSGSTFSVLSYDSVVQSKIPEHKSVPNLDIDAYEYATMGIVPKSQIDKLPFLDSVLADLTIKTQYLRDSLSKVVVKGAKTKISDNKEIDKWLKSAVKGNIRAYCEFAYNVGFLSNDDYPTCYYPYRLYMGEKYGFAPAYYDVYMYLSRLDLKIQLNDLAVYCLIKSYYEGEIHASLILSNLYKRGIYVSKNIEVAEKLYLIHKNKEKPKH